MIGLSLSACVRDILKGIVRESDVAKIIAGTAANTPEGWNRLINGYMNSYWEEFDRADVVALIGRLTIEQPRLTNDNRYPMVHTTKWVKHESDIEWSRDA